MLVECPDCGGQVSDAAPSCPSCGQPVRRAPQPEPLQTIEQTAKRWKAIQAVGVAAVLVSTVSCAATMSKGGASLTVSILGMLGGLGLLLFGRACAWWHQR